MSDLISKQVVLKEIERLMGVYFDRKVVLSKVWDAVDALPSAQETHEERTETHSGDYIDRQAVRNALLDLTPYKSWLELRYRCENSIADAEGRLGGIGECMNAIDDLPSAQPNLDEWCRDCKEYDKERHSCPRWNRVIRHTVEDLKAGQPERKKGTWVLREDLYGSTEAKCSECGFETLVNEEGNGLHEVSDLHYCPNCGADMRGDDHGTD